MTQTHIFSDNHETHSNITEEIEAVELSNKTSKAIRQIRFYKVYIATVSVKVFSLNALQSN